MRTCSIARTPSRHWASAPRRHVRENFLLTRQLREYLTLLLALKYGAKEQLLIA